MSTLTEHLKITNIFQICGYTSSSLKSELLPHRYSFPKLCLERDDYIPFMRDGWISEKNVPVHALNETCYL